MNRDGDVLINNLRFVLPVKCLITIHLGIFIPTPFFFFLNRIKVNMD